MANITVLDQNTINKIAAGEVIERPASVVKELLENAIDAKATAVTVEIKDGGLSLIRVTDNGCGMEKADVPLAFLRHSTSKIKSVEDLFTISSLGFRGEALSSIAAVAQVELITKTGRSLTGVRYQIEGGKEMAIEEIGAPEGSTFLVRNLFYNTPARRKFLKTAATEGTHVADLVEKMALSHPEVSIRFIQNNQNKLHTSGNHSLKDIIYTVYGREIASNLIPANMTGEAVSVTGFIGKPVIARGNRSFENYYINGRYIKSGLICKAIEEAYKPYMMQHKYPFTMLHFQIEPEFLDVNVHPTKMELRFKNPEVIYHTTLEAIRQAIAEKELIPQVKLETPEEKKELKTVLSEKRLPVPEPFEKKRMEQFNPNPSRQVYPAPAEQHAETAAAVRESAVSYTAKTMPASAAPNTYPASASFSEPKTEQMDLFEEKLLEPKAREKHKLIGQLFDTYWLVEFQDKLFIIDQHAAHEKVLYEKTMASLKKREYTSQRLEPPMILTVGQKEEPLLKKYMSSFTEIGFEIEPFGGREYAVRAVPANLFSVAEKDLLLEMLDGLSEEAGTQNAEILLHRVATMSCKAAVKGNNRLSFAEANTLIDELLDLENPYACPHGRPTIISMSRYELEKKFKRIV